MEAHHHNMHGRGGHHICRIGRLGCRTGLSSAGLIHQVYGRHFAKLPDGHISAGYANAGQMIDIVFGALKPMLEEEAEGEAAEVLENLPDKLNLNWQSASRVYIGPQSADLRVRISNKP